MIKFQVEMEEVTHVDAMPFIGIPFVPTNSAGTHVKPFSFEGRNKRILEQKEEKIRKFIEAEKKVKDFPEHISVNVYHGVFVMITVGIA